MAKVKQEFEISFEEMLRSGVHFGHQVQRWNPKMKPFIFGKKGGVHIFDLPKTVIKFREALNFIKDLSSKNGTILFVGTKRQAKDIIAEEAKNAGMPYVNQRWLGGTLTNFDTVKRQIQKIKQMEEEKTKDSYQNMTKKEKLLFDRDLEKLNETFFGIKNLNQVPDALFVIDIKREYIAVSEANKLGIPIIGVVDTNADPDLVSYIIPANDDAIKSIRFISSMISRTIIENKAKQEVIPEKEVEESEKDDAKEVKEAKKDKE